MKMNVTDTVKQACGHWPRILPALGMKVIKNRHQACMSITVKRWPWMPTASSCPAMKTASGR